MLATALGRYRCVRALNDLEERLLYAFTGDVSCNRDVLALLGNLVDFIDINNAEFSALNIVIRCLDQLQKDVFHIFADIAGLCKRCCVCNRKRHIDDLGQRLRQIGLTGSGRTEHENIALLQFHAVVVLCAGFLDHALVVIVYRDSQCFLGIILSDHIFVQESLDLSGLEQIDAFCRILAVSIIVFRHGFVNNISANRNALIADINAFRAGDQFGYLILRSATEGASARRLHFCFICHP